MSDTVVEPVDDWPDLDDADRDALETRWFVLLEQAVAADDPAADPACAEERSKLVATIVGSRDPEQADHFLASGIFDFADEFTNGEDLLARLVLAEAAQLARLRGVVVFVDLVVELAQRLHPKVPHAVIEVLDQLSAQLEADPALRTRVFGDAPTDELAWIAGRAWLELEDVVEARRCFLGADSTASPGDRPALEFMIANCTAEIGEVFDAADWAIRAVESAEALQIEVDEDFIESAADFLLLAFAEEKSSGRPASAYERYRDRYLARPEWFVPRIGEALYLAAAAEMLDDRGDHPGAWVLIERAEAGWQDASGEARAEVVLTKVLLAYGGGRVDVALDAARKAFAVVALGSDAQQARLRGLTAGLMSVLGQTGSASAVVRETDVPRRTRWPDVDPRNHDDRIGFAMTLTEEMLELTHETSSGQYDRTKAAELSDRWLRLAQRAGDAGLIEFSATGVATAAMMARAANQPDRAQQLAERARLMWPSGTQGTGPTGMAQYQGLLERLAEGDISGLGALLSAATETPRSDHEYLGALMSLMKIFTLRASGASDREILGAAATALRAHARWRAVLPSSVERNAFDQLLVAVMPVAYEGLATLAEPRLVAEFIEFVRSQAMPQAQVTATETSVSMQRLLTRLSDDPAGPTGSAQDVLDDEVSLAQAARVRMPWGALALAEFLPESADPVVDLDVPG